MAKFVIECPKCGKFAEASSGLFGTGLFAKRNVKCSCGNVINVQASKLSSRVCPHCGNTVVFDQSKGAAAKCPVCHEPINTVTDQSRLYEFACEQCGVMLQADKAAETFTCPVCDHVNDVAKLARLEKIKNDGKLSVIKYEGDNSTFVWKHPMEDFYLGSQLIVHESQEALFSRDGKALDLFGPGRYTLKTQKLPLLDNLAKLPLDNEGLFHSEVYFINKTVQMAIKWGTPDKVRLIDPLTGTPLELGVCGKMNLSVSDSRKLVVKLVGTMRGIAWEERGEAGFTRSLEESFRPMISSAVKTDLPAVIKANDIDVLEMDSKLDIISEALRLKISAGFEEYGLTVPQLYVTGVLLPENDRNFEVIRELHTVELKKKKAKMDADVVAAEREIATQEELTKTEHARHEAERELLKAEVEAQKIRMSGVAEADVMQAKGYTQRDVLQTDVQKAYAEGIGKMGGSGGSGVMGEMVGLGAGLAAMGVVVPQVGKVMRDMDPEAPGEKAAPSGWTCPECGRERITSKCCPECGAKKPEDKKGWTCPECGKKDITSRFCPECGAKKPEEKKGWTCPVCGKKDITSRFCPECGAKKPEEKKGWTCPECGKKDITSRFCPECGAKKPEEKSTWICPDCGEKDISGKFCPECGRKRDE